MLLHVPALAVDHLEESLNFFDMYRLCVNLYGINYCIIIIIIVLLLLLLLLLFTLEQAAKAQKGSRGINLLFL